MNKRRILIIALVLVLAAVLATGSVAYFTAEDRAHSVIASGGVDIVVNEWADTEKTEKFPEGPIENVVPAMEVTKIAEVLNTGGAEAWIRVRADKAVTLAGQEQPTGDPAYVLLDTDTASWTEKDGWYYYSKPLAPGETTAPLFTTVTFDPKMDNSYMDSSVTIDVVAQAVQTANNGSSALEAAGWPQE